MEKKSKQLEYKYVASVTIKGHCFHDIGLGLDSIAWKIAKGSRRGQVLGMGYAADYIVEEKKSLEETPQGQKLGKVTLADRVAWTLGYDQVKGGPYAKRKAVKKTTKKRS